MALDFADEPQIAEPATSLAIACEFSADKRLNQFPDDDDIVTITRRIAWRIARSLGALMARAQSGRKCLTPALMTPN